MRLSAILLVLLLCLAPGTASAKHRKIIRPPVLIIRPHKPNTWPEVLAFIERDARRAMEERKRLAEEKALEPLVYGPPYRDYACYSPSMFW